MQYFIPAVCVLAGIAVLILLICYICYRMAFYAKRTPEDASGEFTLPPGEIYEPYHDVMRAWADETAKLPCRELEITSFDGLTLRGKYYEYSSDSPIEIMMPGYRGIAQRDLCGGVQRCFALGRSALVVDQRGCGRSDGHVITFGIKERHDCLGWVDLAVKTFPGRKFILTGISMGAATVLMAGSMELPENVVGIIADCGYTSARDIISKVIRDMKLPSKLLYPFVRLAGLIFGGFDLEELSPLEAVKKCRIPVFFAHGDADDFVPCQMTAENHDACPAPKTIVLVSGAGHGLCFPAAPEEYLKVMGDFFTSHGI